MSASYNADRVAFIVHGWLRDPPPHDPELTGFAAAARSLYIEQYGAYLDERDRVAEPGVTRYIDPRRLFVRRSRGAGPARAAPSPLSARDRVPTSSASEREEPPHEDVSARGNGGDDQEHGHGDGEHGAEQVGRRMVVVYVITKGDSHVPYVPTPSRGKPVGTNCTAGDGGPPAATGGTPLRMPRRAQVWPIGRARALRALRRLFRRDPVDRALGTPRLLGASDELGPGVAGRTGRSEAAKQWFALISHGHSVPAPAPSRKTQPSRPLRARTRAAGDGGVGEERGQPERRTCRWINQAGQQSWTGDDHPGWAGRDASAVDVDRRAAVRDLQRTRADHPAPRASHPRSSQ